MNCRNIVISGLLALMVAGLFSVGGCIGDLARNQMAERTGNISLVFINNTEYRAIFTYGVYDAWDRSPGPVELQQLTLAPNSSSSPATLPCARNVAIGTDDFVERVLETEADQADDFDPDAFNTEVYFSSAPADSVAGSLPTAGTARGIEKLLGVDYSCEDRLIFTFVEDPDAKYGFRIDYEVILDEIKD